MTNDELSAKVAVARGEVVYASNVYCFPSGIKAHDALKERIKPYATDMNAAMELVEEAVAAHMTVTMERFWKADSYECRIGEGGGENGLWHEDTTMPRAICRAYLEFKGVAL